MMRMSARIALVLILMLLALEALLHLVPLPDPYAFRSERVHRFLPGWNYYAERFGEAPPLSTTFVTGKLSGVSTQQVLFSLNRFGFPYPESQLRRVSSQEVRIGLVGGSTVECAALQSEKRWLDVLERLLSQAAPRPPRNCPEPGSECPGDEDLPCDGLTACGQAGLEQCGLHAERERLVRVDSADPMLRDMPLPREAAAA